MIRSVSSLAENSPPSIWQALADPTRRSLIDMLSQQPATTSQLCEAFPMSRFGVMKHLALLEDAGLIISRKQGRVRTNHLNPAPLIALADEWIAPRTKRLTRGLLNFSAKFEQGAKSMTEPSTIIEIALDWTIAASPRQVWQALFDRPEDWWPREHRAFGEGSTMHFEPRLGALLEERGANGGGIVWYTVYAIDPLRWVDLRGELARRFGGPASSLLHIALEIGPEEDTTVLKLTDSLTGKVDAQMQRSTTEGWHEIVGKGLVKQFG